MMGRPSTVFCTVFLYATLIEAVQQLALRDRPPAVFIGAAVDQVSTEDVGAQIITLCAANPLLPSGSEVTKWASLYSLGGTQCVG